MVELGQWKSADLRAVRMDSYQDDKQRTFAYLELV